jgi:sugar phosphate isomerase/epimerase
MVPQHTLYSRREFGQIALAAIPLTMALAKIDSKIAGVRIGVQSYSFRTLSLDDAIKAMKDIGIGECELFSGHVEPRAPTPQGGRDPAFREQLRKWRLSEPMDTFKGVRKKFDDAGITLQAYNYSFNDSFTDEEIERGFEMAKALGVPFITASATLSAMKRVAPVAEKHKTIVAVHNHSNITDPNEFAKPETFAAAMALSKYVHVNLDIGHFVAGGFDPVKYIEENHAKITNLHLKDRKKDQGDNVPWGQGDTPIKQVLLLLKQKKYNIPANIEYEYKGQDAVADVRTCFEYCKAALST